MLAKQARLNRQLSRKQKGSKNRYKAKMKLSRLHARIANERQDSLHKLTTDLASNYEVICIEDLNVSGMVKNHNLAKPCPIWGSSSSVVSLDISASEAVVS